MARTKGGDFATIARKIVEKAIGEQLDGSPLPDSGKNKKAAESGRAGGKKGGAARAKTLTAEQRHHIAVKAAQARWKKRVDD